MSIGACTAATPLSHETAAGTQGWAWTPDILSLNFSHFIVTLSSSPTGDADVASSSRSHVPGRRQGSPPRPVVSTLCSRVMLSIVLDRPCALPGRWFGDCHATATTLILPLRCCGRNCHHRGWSLLRDDCLPSHLPCCRRPRGMCNGPLHDGHLTRSPGSLPFASPFPTILFFLYFLALARISILR